MKTTLVVLLTSTSLVGAVLVVMQRRLPQLPRLALAGPRDMRRRSPRAEFATEMVIVTVACTSLPFVAIGLTVLLGVVAAHLG